MIKEFRKYFQNKLLFLPLIVIVLLLVLSSGYNFFHNHEPDFKKHEDCPAHQLHLLLCSILIFIWTFNFVSLLFNVLKIYRTKNKKQYLFKSPQARSPPIQLSIQ